MEKINKKTRKSIKKIINSTSFKEKIEREILYECNMDCENCDFIVVQERDISGKIVAADCSEPTIVERIINIFIEEIECNYE